MLFVNPAVFGVERWKAVHFMFPRHFFSNFRCFELFGPLDKMLYNRTQKVLGTPCKTVRENAHF